MLIFESRSALETRRIGRGIGKRLKAGDVVAIRGPLGAGKTTLVKGVAEGLGFDGERVSSPTFTLIHEYTGRKKIYHIDWYRLRSVKGADALAASECFSAQAVSLVEWAERGRNLLPKERLDVTLSHRGQDRRSLRILAKGKRPQALLECLAS